MPKTLALPEAVQQFFTYLTVEKGFAQGTLTSYRTKLKAFTVFIEAELGRTSTLDKINLQLLRRYLAQRTPGKGAMARANEVTHLQAFFNFLVREGLLNHNPAAVLVKPKQGKRLPVYLTVGECERLLTTVDHYSRCPELEGTILRLLLYTGIRVGELVGLAMPDVNLNARFIRVKGKGSKERLVPLNTTVCTAVQTYLTARPNSNLSSFFLIKKSGTFRPLKRTDAEEIVRKYAQLAGIKHKRVTPHVLRHTFATLLYVNQVGLIELKELLGHVKLVTTEVYTHVSAEQLKQAIACHPLKEDEEGYLFHR